MFDELDTVVLKKDIKKHGLKKGDIGTVVHVYGKKAFEVEFVSASGNTMALITFSQKEIPRWDRRRLLFPPTGPTRCRKRFALSLSRPESNLTSRGKIITRSLTQPLRL